MRDSDRVFAVLTGALQLPLGINDILLAFRALRALVIAQPARVFATSLFIPMLQSFGQINHDLDDPLRTSLVKKEIIQVMLDASLTDIASFWAEAINPHLFLDGLYSITLIDKSTPLDPREIIVQTMTKCVQIANVKTSEHATEYPLPVFVHRLPSEVISQIIAYSLPRGQDWELAGAEHMPLTLGQISSRWRQISLYTPSIWAALDIELTSGPEEERSSAIIPIVNVWLTRSGGLPISITVKCLFSGPSFGLQPHVDRLVHSILPFSRFWQDVHLQLPFSTSKYFYQAHQKYCKMPRLRSFTMAGWGFALHSYDPFLALNVAPSLRVLELQDVGLSFDAVQVSWGQLAELRLRVVGWSTQQCMDMLRSCHQVKSLHLMNQSVRRTQELYVGPIISLPQLEVLHTNHDFNHMIPSMEMPCLRELCMIHSGFSAKFLWAGGDLGKFTSTLFRCGGAVVPQNHSIRDFIAHNKQDRKFCFTVFDSNHLALTNVDKIVPNLAVFAQILGTMEFDCSVCPDQVLIDVVNQILNIIHFSSVYDIAIVARQEVGEGLEESMRAICDKNKNVRVTQEGRGLQVRISTFEGGYNGLDSQEA